MEEHDKFRARFGSGLEGFKGALEKSYDEYAKEVWPDFEEFKRNVKFKRAYSPNKHDKEIRRIRIQINRYLNEYEQPKQKKLRRLSEDKQHTHYTGHENHPLRGRRELPVHPYNIESGVHIPERIIDLGFGEGIQAKFVWPFHFMSVGDSIFVPMVSRSALMKAASNWKYVYRRNMVEEDQETGDWREVKRKFLVSEVYESGLFIGSRIWLVKKEYI